MPRTTRTIAGAAVVAAALAASVLTAPAALAAVAPTSAKLTLADFTGWAQANPAIYDYELETLRGTPSLRFSNAVADNADYGVTQQLSTPAIATAGEPASAADYRVFTAEFTVDAESYDAQPGLAIEVAIDKNGERAGGDIVLRHDHDDQLTITNYYLPSTAASVDDAEWRNKSATVDFEGPVDIRYVVVFNGGSAPDQVTIYVDDAPVITNAGSFDRYHELMGRGPFASDSLLFRTNRNVPAPDGSIAGWTRPDVTEDEKDDLEGDGFYFSDIEYGVSNKALAPSASTISVDASIVGTAVVGGQLSADVSTSEVTTTLKYQWQRGGLSIAGATGKTYTVGANDVGKRITVKVTASKTGFTTGTDTSPQTDTVAAAALSWTTSPVISGTEKLNSTLTATAATSPAASYAYQWLRGGAAIKGATSKTYKLAASDVGHLVSVKVTATKSGYGTLVATSAATGEIQPGALSAGTVTISGSSKVGGTLSASAKGWSASATLKYAWYADNELVQFGPDRKFVNTWYEKGKRITVIVIGSKFGYIPVESAESNARGPIS